MGILYQMMQLLSSGVLGVMANSLKIKLPSSSASTKVVEFSKCYGLPQSAEGIRSLADEDR